MNASKIIWQIVFAKYVNEWFNVAQIAGLYLPCGHQESLGVNYILLNILLQDLKACASGPYVE